MTKDIIYFPFFFQLLCQTKNNSIDRMIEINKHGSFHNNMKLAISLIILLTGMTPSLASYCWHLFYFAHLKLLEWLYERRKHSLVQTPTF